VKAPVVFVFFNRRDPALKVFERIREARPRQLVLVGDGPRAQVQGEGETVEALRREIEGRIDWPGEVRTDYAEENLGCGRRLASGIEAALARYGRAIILEDDCVPNATFFDYCDSLLERYENERRVTSISGTYFLRRSKSESHIGFTHFPCVWGWATWARAWEGYDRTLSGWDESVVDEIAREGHIPAFLRDSWKSSFRWIRDNPDSTWDVQFWFLSLKKRGLSVFPYRNQITNIGAGPGATHTTGSRFCNIRSYPLAGPIALAPSLEVDRRYERYLQVEFYSNTTTWRNVGYKAAFKSRQFLKRLAASGGS
jgi:hypothetical protein